MMTPLVTIALYASCILVAWLSLPSTSPPPHTPLAFPPSLPPPHTPLALPPSLPPPILPSVACAENTNNKALAVSVESVDGANVYHLGGDTNVRYVGADTYYFSNIPQTHPMKIWQDDEECTITKSCTSYDGDYCWGEASWTIPDDCTGKLLSLDCEYHGYMGGKDRLVFNTECSNR